MHCGPTVDPSPLWDSRKWKNRLPGQVWEQTTATSVHLPLTRKPKPCSEIAKNVNEEGPLETTTLIKTQSTVWQDMNRPLYSGCEKDTVACEHFWKELASWTLHSVIAKKQNRWSTTSFWTATSCSNRDNSYGHRMSQPPTSCGEQWKTFAAPPIPDNMWTEGLSPADRPQKKKKEFKFAVKLSLLPVIYICLHQQKVCLPLTCLPGLKRFHMCIRFYVINWDKIFLATDLIPVLKETRHVQIKTLQICFTIYFTVLVNCVCVQLSVWITWLGRWIRRWWWRLAIKGSHDAGSPAQCPGTTLEL